MRVANFGRCKSIVGKRAWPGWSVSRVRFGMNFCVFSNSVSKSVCFETSASGSGSEDRSVSKENGY